MGKIGDKIKMSYFTEGEKRWIKRHTEKTFKKLGINMKSSEKRYQVNTPEAIEFWNKMFAKMNTLLVAMESAKGNYNIDDPEIRWISDRIEYWNSEERLLTPQEMSQANHYWKKYKK